MATASRRAVAIAAACGIVLSWRNLAAGAQPELELAMVDGATFGRSLFLLLFLIVGAGVAIFLVITAWTGIKIWFWYLARKREEQRMQMRKHRPDGGDYPPDERGICTVCGHCFDEVFVLYDKRRLCWHCFEGLTEEEKNAAELGGPTRRRIDASRGD